MKSITKILSIIWGVIGILILAWEIFWYYQTATIGDLGGVLVTTILKAAGLYLLMIYLGISIIISIILLIFWLVKKFQH